MNIKSYAGVDSILFGMTKPDIERILGKPDKIEVGYLGEEIEYREQNGLVTTYSTEEKTLIEIGFSRNIKDLNFKGTYFFRQPHKKTITELLGYNKAPMEYVGFLIFLNIGIALAGFESEDNDDVSVSVFQHGRWDEDIPEMTPYISIPK